MTSTATQNHPLDLSKARKRVAGTAPRQPKQKKKLKASQSTLGACSNEEVLQLDVDNLLDRDSLQTNNHEIQDKARGDSLSDLYSDIEIKISGLSSTGDGLAVARNGKHAYVVPFTLPGDLVKAKIVRQSPHDRYSITDLVKILEPSKDRDNSLIRCPYFASCSGCQFQMLSYDKQLEHKRTVVEKAYRNFSGLSIDAVPQIEPTAPSPRTYGYRTKLTPHFDGPQGMRRMRRKGEIPKFENVPPIGFMKKNTRKTIDIEDCPIGTDAVRLGMKRERRRVSEAIGNYRAGATLLLRQSTKRRSVSTPETEDPSRAAYISSSGSNNIIQEQAANYIYEHSCVTDFKSTTTEFVDDYIFSNPASAFFQNNNYILPTVTSYIRSHILSPNVSSYNSRGRSLHSTSPSKSTPSSGLDNGPQKQPLIKNLIDAYSGSGLFTITLSSQFQQSMGIDIASSSITSAIENLRLNNIPPKQASFIAADAVNLFASVNGSASGGTIFVPDETVVVIDPPRKGCDLAFLEQLVTFGPARIVYVSCNVHTQARDVGMLVGGFGEEARDAALLDATLTRSVENPGNGGNGLYDIESIKGFDFFPQTSHVEVITILQKKLNSSRPSENERE